MARDFESSNNDYLDAGNPSALNLTGDEVTLSTWIRLESTGIEMKIFAKWADVGSQWQYLLSTNGGDKCLFAIYDGSTNIATGTTSLVTNTWYHVAGTYDGSALRIYCNGIEEDLTANTGSMSSTSAPVRIGAGSGGSGTEQPFDGEIGHCAIWDKGLSANEIESLAAGISPLKVRGGNLLSYWPLNGQSPELDLVGSHNMTVTGAIIADEPPISNSIKAP